MSEINILGFEQSDENQYTLRIDMETELGWSGPLDLWMHQGEAYELWKLLDKVIGSHYREGQRAAAEHQREIVFEEIDADGYALDDPKRPGYAEAMREGADLARKQEREG